MSYSSYHNQQDALARILRLEIMLGLLIRNTQTGLQLPATKALLLNFAGVLEAERQAVEPVKES